MAGPHEQPGAQTPTQLSSSGPGVAKFRPRARDTAIPIVIHEENGVLYLDPKPGNETVFFDQKLHIAVLNMTGAAQDVDVEFEYPVDDTKNKVHNLPNVPAGHCRMKKLSIDPSVFTNVPENVRVIVVGYEIRVGTMVLDPDLKIQR